jgi:hypothetical protein
MVSFAYNRFLQLVQMDCREQAIPVLMSSLYGDN